MATCSIDFVENDTGSVLLVTCKTKAGGIIDLTGASVALKYRIDGGTLQTKTMTINPPATAGIVQYQFLAGELIAGEMIEAVEITNSASKVISELCTVTHTIRGKL